MTVATREARAAGPDQRPVMRGWIHLWAFAISLVSGSVLVVLAGGVSPVAAVGCAVYAVSVSASFGVSSLYHRRVWPTRRARTWMRRLDHSMIFVFIAGTYTPFSLLALSPPTSIVVLLSVWGGAVVGVVVKVAWPNGPRWVGTPIYIALGWVAIFVLPELLRQAGVAAFVLLLVGGALYTIGAVFYATKWPNPWPTVFGHHECFHTATVLAATCHYVAAWLVLFPGT